MSSRPNLTTCLILSLLIVLMECSATPAKTIYVDDNATGANDGTSWSDAYVYLQEALADARLADKPVEIRVAQGIYKPNEGLVAIPEFDWRTATFQLINGVTLKGGYAGVGVPNPDAWDVSSYGTTLTGDLDGDDAEVTDPCDLPSESTRAENSYHVVTGNGTDGTAVLDGFIITGGNANGVYSYDSGGGIHSDSGNPTVKNCGVIDNSATQYGGGMYNTNSSDPNVTNCDFSGNWAGHGGGMRNDFSNPTVSNCTFSGNSADWRGGGMDNSYNSPTLTNCLFVGNSAGNGGGMENFVGGSPILNGCTFSKNSANESGGGLHNEYEANPTLINCTFVENSAKMNGGGVYNHERSEPTITECIFIGNSCDNGGGGMWSSMSNPTLLGCAFSRNRASFGGGVVDFWQSNSVLTNCTFHGNTAGEGGGMHSFMESNPILTNCVFSGNSADWGGGGVYITWESNPTLSNCTITGNSADWGGGGMSTSLDSKAVVVNCIVCNNNDSGQRNIAGDFSVSYSNIQGNWPGEGNMDVDPLFEDPGYWADVDDPNIAAEPEDPNAVWVDGDYHLKSEAGRWDPVGGSWVKDDVTSPCIDAGDPNLDWTSETWPHGGRINMGAYGGTREASMSTQPQEMSLPYVAYIHEHDTEAAESYQSLLVSYGCPTTLIELDDVATTAMDTYDLIVVGNDTGSTDLWGEAESVVAIESSGKPILGLGEGGYAFFGKLGLEIGWPNGMHGSRDSIEVIDPNNSLFSVPYAIDVPDDRVLQLYTETEHVGLYLWPMPETVTALGGEVESHGYYPLALEHDRYVLWGFTASPDNMTQVGKTLFVNVVIRAANAAWEIDAK